MAESCRRVGIPVDGSDNSRKAILWFLNNAVGPNDHIIFIHVQEPPDLPLFNLKSGFNIPTEQWMKTITERNRLDEEIRTDVISMCREKNLACEYVSLMDKKPGEGIVTKVGEMDIDFIIMGSRGLSTLRRTILGSVSDYVLHHAQVPVCIIPREYQLYSKSSTETCSDE